MRFQRGLGAKDLAAVRTGIGLLLNAAVDGLDVTVEMAFLGEHFAALGAGGGLVDLQVQVDLFHVAIERALFAQDLAALRTTDALDAVGAPDVGGQILGLLAADGTGHVAGRFGADVLLQSVQVETGFVTESGIALITVHDYRF